VRRFPPAPPRKAISYALHAGRTIVPPNTLLFLRFRMGPAGRPEPNLNAVHGVSVFFVLRLFGPWGPSDGGESSWVVVHVPESRHPPYANALNLRGRGEAGTQTARGALMKETRQVTFLSRNNPDFFLPRQAGRFVQTPEPPGRRRSPFFSIDQRRAWNTFPGIRVWNKLGWTLFQTLIGRKKKKKRCPASSYMSPKPPRWTPCARV